MATRFKLLLILSVFALLSCTNEDNPSDATEHSPADVSFVDQDADINEIGGEIVIHRTGEESNITQYSIYWGVNSDTRIHGYDAIYIAPSPENTEPIKVNLKHDTEIPRAASHIVVFAENEQGEKGIGIGVEINDLDEDIFLYKAFGPGGNEKTGKYFFGINLPALKVTKSPDDPSICLMENRHVSVMNLNHSSEFESLFRTYAFPCFENRYKSVNGAYSPINDAFFWGQVVHDMYVTYLGIPPLATGSKIKLRVHYGTNYTGAFWNGISAAFGDGNSDRYHPVVSLNMVAHEVSHGFTERFSGELGIKQKGVIDEAFSYIAGEVAEYFFKGECDYMYGTSILKSPFEARRYFADPPLDGESIATVKDYSDGMNPHAATGVYTKPFYLLATLEGWDPQKAFEVFAHANMTYWNSNTDFQSGAQDIYQSAVDLGYNAREVKKAFFQTDILVIGEDSYALFSHDSNFLTVNFSDKSGSPNSKIVKWEWNFGDDSTSDLQNPVHTYFTPSSEDEPYIVSLRIFDEHGMTANWYERVVVLDGYCESLSNNCSEEWISEVNIGDFNYPSGPGNYSENTTDPMEFRPGESYEINLTAGYCENCPMRNEQWGVWIDFNKDGDFEDDGEMVFTDQGTETVSGQITIPNSVNITSTKLRVVMTGGAKLESCGKFAWGEVEDYQVNLLAPKVSSKGYSEMTKQ